MSTRSVLAAALIVATAGCRTGSQDTEQASLGVPQRDLTLQQAATPDSEVASALEVGRLATTRATTRPAARSTPRPRAQASRTKLTAAATPAPASTSTSPAAVVGVTPT